jgi:hypothetical protein
MTAIDGRTQGNNAERPERRYQLISGQYNFWAYGCVIAFIVSLRLRSVSL